MREPVVPLHPTFQPLLFQAVALAGGIFAERFLAPTVSVPLLLTLALLCGGFCLIVHARLCRRELQEASREVVSLVPRASVLFLIILLIGYAVLGALHARVCARDRVEHQVGRLFDQGVIPAGEPVEVIGRLLGPPERAPRRVYLDIGVQQITVRRQMHRAGGRLRLMVVLGDESAQHDFARLQAAGLDYGARLRVLTQVDRPSGYRNPGSLTYGEYLESRGYDLAGVVKSPLLVTVLERNDALSFRSILYDLRQAAERQLDRLFSPRTAGILKALLLGNRFFLDDKSVERFRAGGTFHLLVISGAHIAALAGALLWLMSHYTRRWGVRAVTTIGVLWAYAVAVGGQAPVARATVMMAAALVAPFLFRHAQPANVVGLAAFVLLVHNPQELASPSFQLTFLAVLSIVLLGVPLIRQLQAIGQWQPTVETPEPPACPLVVRLLAETLFWDERRFRREQQSSPIRFHLDKADAARWLSRYPGLQPVVRSLGISLLVSLVAQIALLPLMVIYFHRVVLAGIVLNVVIGVWVALIGASGILAVILSVSGVPLAPYAARVTDALVEMMMRSFEPVLSFRGASFRVPHYSGPWVVIYVVYFGALVYGAVWLNGWRPLAARDGRRAPAAGGSGGLGGRRARARGVIALGAASFLLIVAYPVGHRFEKGRLRVHFLDVGQGDCILLELPDGTLMLVDGGGQWRWQEGTKEQTARSPDRAAEDQAEGEPEFTDETRSVGELAVSPVLWSKGVKRIDYVVLTHAHGDHLEGLFAVVKNFDVGRVLIAEPPRADARFDRFARLLASRRIPVQVLGMGDRFQIAGVEFTVVWPPARQPPPLGWDNNRSLVIRVSYGEVSILLTGDIEREEEAAMLAAGFDLRSQVVKVPHHGSRTSSSPEFIARARPRWAIVTAPERSRFSHPHPEVVERYRAHGAQVLQTGCWGMITLTTDGRTLTLSAWNHPSRNQ